MRKVTRYIIYFLLLSIIFSIAIYFSIPKTSPYFNKIIKYKDIIFKTKYEIANYNLDQRKSLNDDYYGIFQRIIEFSYNNHKHKLFVFIHLIKGVNEDKTDREILEYQLRLKRNKNIVKDYINAYFFDPNSKGEIFDESFNFNFFDLDMRIARLNTRNNIFKTKINLSISNLVGAMNIEKTIRYKYKKKRMLKKLFLITYDKNNDQYYIDSNFKGRLF